MIWTGAGELECGEVGEGANIGVQLSLQSGLLLHITTQGEEGDIGDVGCSVQHQTQVVLGYLQVLEQRMQHNINTEWLL